MKHLHRGRFQAQGKNIEESNKWAQNEPLTIWSAIELLDHLQQKLNMQQIQVRIASFEKCKQFIHAASLHGGVCIESMGKPLIKSFPKNHTERLDLEVHSGIAFINNYK